MNSPLQRLLLAIDPARTYEEGSRRVAEALNTFPMPPALITDWYGFQACLIRFLQHLDHHLLRLPLSVSTHTEIAWNRCREVLIGIYGDSGPLAAFECARTGNEEGLYGVLKSLARGLADQYALAETKAQVWAWFNCGRLKVTLLAATMRSFSFVTAAQNRRYSFAVVSSGPRECNPALNHAQVWAFWDSLSIPAKLAATDEYLQLAGQLVPGEIAEGSAVRIRANLPKVLIEHPKLLRQLRQAVRR